MLVASGATRAVREGRANGALRPSLSSGRPGARLPCTEVVPSCGCCTLVEAWFRAGGRSKTMASSLTGLIPMVFVACVFGVYGGNATRLE
jgi:hypothetical protein